jgi:hypothetical protein
MTHGCLHASLSEITYITTTCSKSRKFGNLVGLMVLRETHAEVGNCLSRNKALMSVV